MFFTVEIAGNRHELTPWLPGSQQPAHAGVYQRNYPGGPYSLWDGRVWRADAATPDAAAAIEQPSVHQQASWRGLAQPAEPSHAERTAVNEDA